MGAYERCFYNIEYTCPSIGSPNCQKNDLHLFVICIHIITLCVNHFVLFLFYCKKKEEKTNAIHSRLQSRYTEFKLKCVVGVAHTCSLHRQADECIVIAGSGQKRKTKQQRNSVVRLVSGEQPEITTALILDEIHASTPHIECVRCTMSLSRRLTCLAAIRIPIHLNVCISANYYCCTNGGMSKMQ